MATGGIGIRYGGGDVSADLPQLAALPAHGRLLGPKHVADAAATIEWLETHGVQLVGYRTDGFPGSWPPAGSRWSRWPTTWTRWWS